MQVEQDDYFRVVSLKATRKHKEHYDKKKQILSFLGNCSIYWLEFCSV